MRASSKVHVLQHLGVELAEAMRAMAVTDESR